MEPLTWYEKYVIEQFEQTFTMHMNTEFSLNTRENNTCMHSKAARFFFINFNDHSLRILKEHLFGQMENL